jgi:hypothetical protein
MAKALPSIDEEIVALNARIAQLEADRPAPVAPPPPSKPTWSQLRHSWTVMDIVNGSPFLEERKSCNTLDEAKKEAESRANKRGGWKVIYANWRITRDEAINAQYPGTPDKWGHKKANCILIVQEVEAASTICPGFSVIHDWPFSQPIPKYLQL